MRSNLRDRLILLRFIHTHSDDYDLTDEVKDQIKEVFGYYKDKIEAKKKPGKRDLNRVNLYIRLINNCDSTKIVKHGIKILGAS